MSKETFQTDKPVSLELIVYQIGQLDKSVAQMNERSSQLLDKINMRITQLELWRASVQNEKENPPLDVTKIILAAFGLVSTAIALFASLQAGWIK